jgi:hypothetical protein
MKRLATVQLLVVCSFVQLLTASNGVAQSSSGGSYAVSQKVVAAGGMTSAGGSFAVTGTIGQHDTAISSGGAFTIAGGFWPDTDFNPPSPNCVVDVTAQLSIVRGGFKYSLLTRRYHHTVTIRNNGATTIDGPLVYALDDLSPNAELFNPAGWTNCAAPTSPYQILPITNDALAPGEVTTLVLEFTNAAATQLITYSPRILAGKIR